MRTRFTQYALIVVVLLAITGCNSDGLAAGLPRVWMPVATCTEPHKVSSPLFGCPGNENVITRVGILVSPTGRVADVWFTSDSEDGGPQHEACVLSALQAWEFISARDCEGNPVVAVARITFVAHHTAAADRLAAQERVEASRNNEMQWTKPAQAMELRR